MRIAMMMCVAVLVSCYLFGLEYESSSSAAEKDVQRPVRSDVRQPHNVVTKPDASKARGRPHSGSAPGKEAQGTPVKQFKEPYKYWDDFDRKKVSVSVSVSDTMTVSTKLSLNEAKRDARYTISLKEGSEKAVMIKTFRGNIASFFLDARKKEHIVTVLVWRARTVVCLTYDLNSKRLYENAFFEISEAKDRRIFDGQVIWSILGIPYWTFTFSGTGIETWNGITGKCIAKYRETYADKRVPK